MPESPPCGEGRAGSARELLLPDQSPGRRFVVAGSPTRLQCFPLLGQHWLVPWTNGAPAGSGAVPPQAHNNTGSVPRCGCIDGISCEQSLA